MTIVSGRKLFGSTYGDCVKYIATLAVNGMGSISDVKICANASMPSGLWGDLVCFSEVSGSEYNIQDHSPKKEHEAFNRQSF